MPPDPPALPALLQLPPHRSVLPSGNGERLLGLDPDTAIVVGDLSPPLAELLDDLDGTVSTNRLVADAVARGAPPGAAESLLQELVDAGALVDAAALERARAHRRRSAVVVVGCGPLTVGIVVGLLRAQVGAVHTVIDGTVRAPDLGTGLHPTDIGTARVAALRRAVARLAPPAHTDPPPRRLAPDLVVLADETPDPVRLAELMINGTTHLTARLRDGVGIVGPLVLPGRSACLGCVELHRSARDEGWPAVAARLIGRRGSADQACTTATAALATAQVLAALDGAAGGGAAPATLDATLELNLAAGRLVRREWSAVPGCLCSAAPPDHRTSDGVVRHGGGTSADCRGRDTIGR